MTICLGVPQYRCALEKVENDTLLLDWNVVWLLMFECVPRICENMKGTDEKLLVNFCRKQEAQACVELIDY